MPRQFLGREPPMRVRFHLRRDLLDHDGFNVSPCTNADAVDGDFTLELYLINRPRRKSATTF